MRKYSREKVTINSAQSPLRALERWGANVVRVDDIAPRLLDRNLIPQGNASLSKPAKGLLMKKRPEYVKATSHDL